MRSRGMVGVTAFALAAIAAFAMFLFLHGVQHSAQSKGSQVSVVVSKKDLPAGTSMDAVTSAEQLKGRVTSVPILAGEQIPVARLQGSTSLPGGAIGIPAGYEGVTFQLEAQRIIGGQLHPSDHVAIYGSFSPPDFPYSTVTLVPDVKVLKIAKPSTVDQASTQGNSIITVALRPQDVEKVVFGQEHGSVWMALLPPGQVGHHEPPMYTPGVLK